MMPRSLNHHPGRTGCCMRWSSSSEFGCVRLWRLLDTSLVTSGALGARVPRTGCAGGCTWRAPTALDMRGSCAPELSSVGGSSTRRRNAPTRPALASRTISPAVTSRPRWIWTARRLSPVSLQICATDGQQRSRWSAREVNANMISLAGGRSSRSRTSAKRRQVTGRYCSKKRFATAGSARSRPSSRNPDCIERRGNFHSGPDRPSR